MTLLAAGAAWCDQMAQVTSQSAQNATDTIGWGQFGGDQTVLGATFGANMAPVNQSVSVSLAGPNSVIARVCGGAPCSWTGAGFGAGDSLLWASDAGNGGTGPIVLRFPAGITGAGALIQTDAPGGFTAQIQAYNGSTLLGLFNVVSGGTASYAGITDLSGANITAIALTITSCNGNCMDFAIDTVYVNRGSTGGGPPNVGFNPGSLTFGSQQVGTTSGAQSITVTSNGGAPLAISSITASGDFGQTNNCPGSLGVGSTCTINVTFTPSAPGTRNGSISVSDNAGGSPQSISLSGTGTGTAQALQFVPVTPCRIVDTRSGNGGELAAQSTRNFAIGGQCGIPANAAAYSLNVTVVPDAQLAYLTVWPAGQGQPNVSTLNSDGRIKANAAIVPAGSGGQISVFAYNSTQLIVDTNGYFVPAGTSGALSFYPITPCRIADTRNGPGPSQGPGLSAQTPRSFAIKGSTNSCTSSIPSSAQAYSLNFTAIPPNNQPLIYLTVWPAGTTQPVVSTLNDVTGTIAANAAIVPGNGTGGAVSVFAWNDTDLVIDINGYFAPPGSGGLSMYNVTPCRVLDTRNPPSFNGSPFQGSIAVNVAGSGCGVPAAAKAYTFNATVVPPGFMAYLTLWPDGQSQPTVSTLNALDGAVTSNMAIVPTANGSIDAFASNPTHLILDISSYFAP